MGTNNPVKPFNFIVTARRGAQVRRYHTSLTSHDNTVGYHSYGVAVLVDVLCEGKPSLALLRAALYHDTAEQWTGDLPAPVKARKELRNELAIMEDSFANTWGLPLDEDLTPEERTILSWADLLDLMFYCYEERCRGNTSLNNIFRRAGKWLEGRVAHHDRGAEVLRWLQNRWDAGINVYDQMEEALHG